MTEASSKCSDEWWKKGLELEEAGDLIGAEKAYFEAAKLGHSMAQLNLGNILDDYRYPPDRAAAVHWYIEAWKQGESSAAWNLHVHYRTLGTEGDAALWFKRAAEMGHPEASSNNTKFQN
jgi:uncharacterized protein